MSDIVHDWSYVVTGATGGLGQALSLEVAKKGGALVLVARNIESLRSLRDRCLEAGARGVNVLVGDLMHESGVKEICNALEGESLLARSNVVLINNASTIEPIEKFDSLAFEALDRALRINVTSAAALSAVILRGARQRNGAATFIVNISSGAALNAVAGWSAYCISKAALNMVSKCIAAEAGASSLPIYSVAINPGPLDTRMQECIRNSDRSKSPAAEKFANMHAEGKLKSPAQVAAKIIGLIEARDFSPGEFVDFNVRT